jgi:hypothetical protein
MYPRATVDTALCLSAIGILDKENARICGVSVAAIRHWRAGRRRFPSGTTAVRRTTCPRCRARPPDEPAYAYLLGLYFGDGHIARGPREVYVLAIACADDWPGLITAARQALTAVMPTSSVSNVRQTGCTMIKSYSKHWTCLFPQHGPGRKQQRKTELAQWQEAIVRRYPGEFARGLFHSGCWRGANRVRRRLADGDHWYEYPRYIFGTAPGRTAWMRHPRRSSDLDVASTLYRPGGPGWRARITSHGSAPGAQQHQEARPGRAPPAQDQALGYQRRRRVRFPGRGRGSGRP